MTTIKNIEDVRAAVVTLTSNLNNMCNATTTEAVSNEFISAKDLLVALFKYNVERTSK